MVSIKSIKDIYPAVDELVTLLDQRDGKQKELSTVIKHRMYKVSWTSGTELLRELEQIFKDFTRHDNHRISELLLNQINKIVEVIEDYFKNRLKNKGGYTQ